MRRSRRGQGKCVLLGEFEQRLDDKNRVTLPARLREHFADGVVCARGFDGCVSVWSPGSWDSFVNEQVDRLERALRTARPVVDRELLVAG